MNRTIAVMLLIIGLILPLAHSQDYRFVNPSSPFPGSGFFTWDTASHTIQQAIDTANPGDIIFVADGTYVENVIVNKDVWIESWCREPATCIIQAAVPSSPAVTIADPTPDSGLLIFHGFQMVGGSYGIYVSGNSSASTDYPIVSGCLFDGYPGTAFYATQTTVILEYCTFVNNYTGAHFSNVNGSCWVRYNIFAYNSQNGLQVTGPYLQMGNNCYYNNLFHIFGAPTAFCDQWSADALPSGVDPQFVDYAAGDFHLQSSSPCVDYNPGDFGYPQCYEANLYDKDESRIDLGAYGGRGNPPNDPGWVDNSRNPSPWEYRVPQDADIQFGLEDWPAGINPESVQVTISDHGHPSETFGWTDFTFNICDTYGTAPSDCIGFCYNFTLPGALHQQFEDYAYVRVSVYAEDNCPTPNTFSSSWRFHADDVTAPILTSHYPADGQTGVPLYGPLVFQFDESPGVGLDYQSLEVLINGAVPPADTDYHWSVDGVMVVPGTRFSENTAYSIQVRVADDYGNQMPWESYGFTTGVDNYPPFVPGVSTPPGAPVPPPDCDWPNPEPGSTTGIAYAGISFVVQDYEHPVDLTNLVVTVSTFENSWTFTATGTSPFYTYGSPYCTTVYLPPPPGGEGWGIDVDVTVEAEGARDTSSSAFLMTPVQWTFHTVIPPLPTTGTWGIILMVVAVSIGVLRMRR